MGWSTLEDPAGCYTCLICPRLTGSLTLAAQVAGSFVEYVASVPGRRGPNTVLATADAASTSMSLLRSFCHHTPLRWVHTPGAWVR